MNTVRALLEPSARPVIRVTVDRRCLRPALHELHTPTIQDIDCRIDLHVPQRMIRSIGITNMSFAPARFNWLIN